MHGKENLVNDRKIEDVEEKIIKPTKSVAVEISKLGQGLNKTKSLAGRTINSAKSVIDELQRDDKDSKSELNKSEDFKKLISNFERNNIKLIKNVDMQREDYKALLKNVKDLQGKVDSLSKKSGISDSDKESFNSHTSNNVKTLSSSFADFEKSFNRLQGVLENISKISKEEIERNTFSKKGKSLDVVNEEIKKDISNTSEDLSKEKKGFLKALNTCEESLKDILIAPINLGKAVGSFIANKIEDIKDNIELGDLKDKAASPKKIATLEKKVKNDRSDLNNATKALNDTIRNRDEIMKKFNSSLEEGKVSKKVFSDLKKVSKVYNDIKEQIDFFEQRLNRHTKSLNKAEDSVNAVHKKEQEIEQKRANRNQEKEQSDGKKVQEKEQKHTGKNQEEKKSYVDKEGQEKKEQKHISAKEEKGHNVASDNDRKVNEPKGETESVLSNADKSNDVKDVSFTDQSVSKTDNISIDKHTDIPKGIVSRRVSDLESPSISPNILKHTANIASGGLQGVKEAKCDNIHSKSPEGGESKSGVVNTVGGANNGNVGRSR